VLFLGGRRFGPWLMIRQSFGVGTHAEMPVALAGAVYSFGASAIWFQWKNLFITPFYWIMAPIFRRIRRTTMAEFTEDRYGPWMGAIYIVFARSSSSTPAAWFGFACRQLLFPGALGLLIASILAANMSTCSAFLVSSGALFTEGLYRRRLVPGRPDAHYLRVGRVSGLIITIMGVLYALFLIQSVLYTFLLTETLATFVGISVLGGIIWPRANRWGALASLAAALTTNFVLYYVTGQRLDHWDPNVFLAALLAGIAALVVFSYATPLEPAGSLESFFGRLQVPSDTPEPAPGAAAWMEFDPAAADPRALPRPGGPERTAGVSAVLDVAAAPLATQTLDRPLLLVNLLQLRRAAAGRGWRAYREDLGGFAVGWLMVIALVAATAAFLAM
jgi:Na+/proline symporter